MPGQMMAGEPKAISSVMRLEWVGSRRAPQARLTCAVRPIANQATLTSALRTTP